MFMPMQMTLSSQPPQTLKKKQKNLQTIVKIPRIHFFLNKPKQFKWNWNFIWKTFKNENDMAQHENLWTYNATH